MVDVKDTIQLTYIAVSVTILFLRYVPALQNRLLVYGPRETVQSTPASKSGSQPPHKSWMTRLLDLLAAPRVPHAWFASFYAVLLASLSFWTIQYLLKGSVYSLVVDNTRPSTSSMTSRQVVVVSIMASVQGIRRLYESVSLTKPSSSTMYIGHWAGGVLFYLVLGVAIWIEGIPELQRTGIQAAHLRFSAPSFRSIVATLLFILASGFQHDCHVYLASLKKYSVPQHPTFNALVCPHYTAECVIYLALAIQAAPKGQWLNQTLLCALAFVVVNLSVTADGTRAWYIANFGSESVKGKDRIIPFVY